MNENDLLAAELRAVREELARRELQNHPLDNSAMVAPRDDQFPRLERLSEDQLEAHEERLERDLEDLEAGFPADPDAGSDPEDGDESNVEAETDD